MKNKTKHKNNPRKSGMSGFGVFLGQFCGQKGSCIKWQHLDYCLWLLTIFDGQLVRISEGGVGAGRLRR